MPDCGMVRAGSSVTCQILQKICDIFDAIFCNIVDISGKNQSAPSSHLIAKWLVLNHLNKAQGVYGGAFAKSHFALALAQIDAADAQ